MLKLTYPRFVACLAVAVCLSFAASLPAAEQKTSGKRVASGKYRKPKPTRFLRVKRNKKDVPQSLETAIVRYVPVQGNGKLVVDLVGAVHIGERSYYRELDKRFKDYDVVLYELVAPKGTRIKRGERNKGTFAMIIKTVLQLDSQVARINYMAKNFVHADMSPAEMSKAMKKRGETGFTLATSILSDLFREQNRRMATAQKQGRPLPQIDLATLLFDPNRSIKLKRVMAGQFDMLGDDGATGLGNTLNRMLIVDRNAACLKVLDQQIKKGHKKIAIFYGAAHMPAFEKSLLADYGLKRDKVAWLMAWDMED